MPRNAINVSRMLSSSRICSQVLEATRKLGEVLGKEEDSLGRAYEVCHVWQRRFEWALQNEIPDWVGFAAFRCITDFNVFPESLKIPDEKKQSAYTENNCKEVRESNIIDSFEKFWCAYILYFGQKGKKVDKENIHSGKLILGGEVEDFFLKRLDEFEPLLGGQAGNILWLWHSIGADPIAYVPYFFKDLADLPKKLPELASLRLFLFGNRMHKIIFLGDGDAWKCADVPCKDVETRVGAPSGGSIVMSKGGRRLIYQFKGMRDLRMKPESRMSWKEVQFVYNNEKLLDKPIERTSESDITWPSLPFLCECWIESNKTLIVRIIEEEEIRKAFKGKADFAIIGGVDALFRDDWINRDQELQARLLVAVENQLRALAACGIRIGVELSGVPGREYAYFVRRLCQEGIIVALGINGIDELPDVVGEKSLSNQLYEYWFDPQTLDVDLRKEVNNAKKQGMHFEYITYLRAKKLAEATGVRTLYVHTLTLDFILRKDADPGALLRAQLGDMMAKGLVIAALLMRAYGNEWLHQIKEKMTPAVKPESMTKLGKFAEDFEHYEEIKGARERILYSGYWLAPSHAQYSLSVVPVMWPAVSEENAAATLPERLNPTGAGDMTFGAFFFLGGV